MAFNYDEHTAAFGVFHLIFAILDNKITTSLVSLLRTKERNLAFRIVMTMPLERRVDILKEYVHRLKESKSAGSEVEELERACKKISDIKKWRNDRIHATIQIENGSIRLLNKSGSTLLIESHDCQAMTNAAIAAMVTLQCHIPALVNAADVSDIIHSEWPEPDQEVNS